MILNQLSMQEARKLLDYRDGMLFWRHAGSGRRSDLRAVIFSADRVQINVGGKKLDARYAVWNWHHGITRNRIVPANGDACDIRIDNLREIEIIGTPSAPAKMACPCCAQIVPVPTVPVIAEICGLTPTERKILEAVWAGGGSPVQTEPIFSRMFEDDPDGGPTPQKMYLAFKVALSHMKTKLQGSGVSIENVGYRQGYRLVMGAN